MCLPMPTVSSFYYPTTPLVLPPSTDRMTDRQYILPPRQRIIHEGRCPRERRQEEKRKKKDRLLPSFLPSTRLNNNSPCEKAARSIALPRAAPDSSSSSPDRLDICFQKMVLPSMGPSLLCPDALEIALVKLSVILFYFCVLTNAGLKEYRT